MINLIKRPIGHKLDVQAQEGTAFDYAGDVGIYTGTAHGLSDGDYVYVDSNIDSYNGFKYVDSVNYNTFKLKESENGEYVPFKQAVTINFYISTLNHYWQCVHLPIVYELESDIFPNNTGEESYQPNTVVSFANNSGYVQINLAQALSDPEELSKIELVGGTMAGVYQIITVLQPWSVVIDLAYSSGYSFTGSVVVKYYDNYAINVNIYAGLESGHPWESEKPFELAATLKFIPDSDNKVKFSIAEILKGYIETRNKLDLDTLPNNADFMVSFYISYFETYDQSDGEEITTFTSETITDSVTGYATNSKLEFKSLNSGHMSDYINSGTATGKWLTTFDRPFIIVGQFFDLSFINQFTGNITITTFKRAGMVVTQEDTVLTNPGKGIIRLPVIAEAGYDEYCIQASIPGSSGSTGPLSLPALSSWLSSTNIPDPADVPWNLGATPDVTLPGMASPNDVQSEYLYTLFDFQDGENYSVTFDYTWVVNSGASLPKTAIIVVLDNSLNVVYISFFAAATGANSNTINFAGSASTQAVGIFFSSGSDVTVTVTAVSGTGTIDPVDPQTLTEQICIDILTECSSTLRNDDLRLTEGDQLRALE